jgi:hypothetical protein
MEGLHATIKDFWKPGDVRNRLDRNACVFQCLVRAPRGDELNTELVERFRQLDNPPLVRDAKKRPANLKQGFLPG